MAFLQLTYNLLLIHPPKEMYSILKTRIFNLLL